MKSKETKNLDHVTARIIESAKEKQLTVRGPRYMPNKRLLISVRKSPCGEGTNTYDKWQMSIHTRVVEVSCPASVVSELTSLKVRPGVDINIKVWN